MTGFTDRTVRRALGANGPIQPRIAPVTAPEPWTMRGPATSLEEVAEVEVPSDPGARRARREPPRREHESSSPREREPREQQAVARDESILPHGQDVLVSHGRESRGAHEQDGLVSRERDSYEQDLLVPRERDSQEPCDQALHEGELDAPRVPASSREPSVLAPTVPSFRARRFALLMASSPPPQSTRGLDLEEGLTLEAPETVAPAVAALGPTEVSTGRGGPDIASATREGRFLEAQSEHLKHAAQHPPRVTPSSGRVIEPGTSSFETEVSPWAPASLALDAAPMRSSLRGSDNRGPVVRVEIGRVEVRAPSPLTEPSGERGIPKPEAFVSLRQYLHKRGAS